MESIEKRAEELYPDDEEKRKAFILGAEEAMSEFHYIINQRVYPPSEAAGYTHLAFPYDTISAPEELEGKVVGIYIKKNEKFDKKIKEMLTNGPRNTRSESPAR